MKCQNSQIIALCPVLVLLGCWWQRKDMMNVARLNMVHGLVDEESKVIFIFFRILIILLMILWLWVIIRGGKGFLKRLCGVWGWEQTWEQEVE